MTRANSEPTVCPLRFFEEACVLRDLVARWTAWRRMIRIQGLMLELLAVQPVRNPR